MNRAFYVYRGRTRPWWQSGGVVVARELPNVGFRLPPAQRVALANLFGRDIRQFAGDDHAPRLPPRVQERGFRRRCWWRWVP